MAHFAEIDENNKVIRVLVIDNKFEDKGELYLSKTLGLGGRWIQTSYNSKIRGKFAGEGDSYDELNDRFIEAQPFPSWILNSDFIWEAPKPMPNPFNHYWAENKLDWVERESIAQ